MWVFHSVILGKNILIYVGFVGVDLVKDQILFDELIMGICGGFYYVLLTGSRAPRGGFHVVARGTRPTAYGTLTRRRGERRDDRRAPSETLESLHQSLLLGMCRLMIFNSSRFNT